VIPICHKRRDPVDLRDAPLCFVLARRFYSFSSLHIMEQEMNEGKAVAT